MKDDLGEVLSIKQLVYNRLKARIISGELKPGSRLLEAELAEQMNISRAPIREAFNMLEKDGFTKIIPRRGAIVAEITEEDIFAIWEFRLLLEPYSAQKTYKMMTDEELNKMKAKIDYVKEHPEDFDAYMSSDLEVHDLLCKYLDNPFMMATLENVKAHSLRIRWEDEYSDEGHRLPETSVAVNSEHHAIIDALMLRDEKQIKHAVLNHVLNSTHRIMKACNMELTDEQKARIAYFEAEVQK